MKTPMLSRRSFLKQSAFAGLSLSAASKSAFCSATDAKRPNIIMILTDDQRWDSMGCMGNPIIHTPNLDRMASEGVLFRNHFSTTSICMSSRASIFTGLYTCCHQIDLFSKPLAPEIFANSYPALLRKAGYRTAFVGKWGLGGPLPEEDFDYFQGFSGQGQYFLDQDGREVHLTGVIGQQACDFLKTCANSQKPFCLSLSTKAPHVQDGHPDPFRYDPQYKDLYQDDEIPEPETADPKYYDALPDFIRNSEGRTRWTRRFSTPELYQHSVKNYYRLITGVDAIVGKIRAQLESLNLADNTVIIYTSDQGFFLGEHGLAGKWLMHEESIRAPLIIYDPRLPRQNRGERSAMTLNIDFAPTLMDLAGIDIPSNIQGQSLTPLLTG
ncbi:MAG: sulfatase family protein, partial [Candidatus Hinthialibacter sp.]